MKAKARFHAYGQRAGMWWPDLHPAQAMRLMLGVSKPQAAMQWEFVWGFFEGRHHATRNLRVQKNYAGEHPNYKEIAV